MRKQNQVNELVADIKHLRFERRYDSFDMDSTVQMVKKKLKEGVSPLQRNDYGESALSEAAKGYPEIVEAILSHYKFRITGPEVDKALRLACSPFRHERDGKKKQDDYLRIVKMLLKAGANPNTFSVSGRTALRYAKRYGTIEIFDTILANPTTNVDVQDPDGQTVLMSASLDFNVDVVRKLLRKGADPNVRNNDGASALDMILAVARSASGEDIRKAESIVFLLIRKGADIKVGETKRGLLSGEKTRSFLF